MAKFRIALAALAVTAIAPIAIGGGVASTSTSTSTSTARPAAVSVHDLRQVLPRSAVDSSNYLCADYIHTFADLSDCVNPATSVFSPGETINVEYANYGINMVPACTVGYLAGECTPFNSGSNCNSHWKGFTVWYLQWNANKPYYMRNEHTHSDQILISKTLDAASEWLYGPTASGVYVVVNVAATNDAGVTCSSSDPGMALTYRPNTGTIYSEPYGSYDAWKQSWSFTGF